MKIKQKLIGSFLVVAAICLIVGVVGWYGISNVNSSLNEVGNMRLPAVDALLTIDAIIGDIAKSEMELLNPLVPISEAQHYYEVIDSKFSEIENESSQFKKLIMDDAEMKLFNEFHAAFENFKTANTAFVDYSKKLDETGIRNPVQVKFDIKNIESAHRDWIFKLSETVVEGSDFKGQLDPTKCALGHWMENYNLDNKAIKSSFTTIKPYHDELHNSGRTIQEIFAEGKGGSQNSKAMSVFDEVAIPSMAGIINELQFTMQPEADKSTSYYEKMIEVEETALDPAFKNMMAVLDRLVTDIKSGALESQKAGDDAVAFSDTLIVISIIFGVALALGFGFIIARNISNPIEKIAAAAENISVGDVEQDLSTVKSKDEIGILANSFRNLISYIKELALISEAIAANDLTKTVQPKSERDVLGNSFKVMSTNLRTMISDLTKNTNELVSAATEIASASEQMSRGAEDQTNQVNQISTAVEEMAATIVESSRNASEASDSSSSASKTATEGGQIVSDTISGMQNIAGTVRQSADSITKLSKSADQIGEIIAVIDDIADQTNLLALNAAIEAARAGDQGRGFAVVADEVRKLAERTGKATSEITGMIQGIQAQTDEAVQSMEAGIQEVEKGRELTDRAGNSLNEIVTMSEQVMNMIQQIATASEEQSTAAEQISQNIEKIASVTRETSTGAQQSAAAAEQLNRQAEGLKLIVEQFKL